MRDDMAGKVRSPFNMTEIVAHTMEEVEQAIGNSPIHAYMKETLRISSDIPREFLLSDALLVAGMVLANRGVRIGYSQDDYDAQYPNFYTMKIAESGGGKGRTSRFVTKGLLPAFGLVQINGRSEASMIGLMKDSPAGAFGLFYEPEIRRLMDPSSMVSSQTTNFLLAAWDNGKVEFNTRPRGEPKILCVDPAYPSCLIDGQPKTIENALDKGGLIDAGFLARFLISYPPGFGKRIFNSGSPSIEAIRSAYAPYFHAERKIVIRGREPDSKLDRVSSSLTEPQRAAWGRLMGQYVPRIALLLDPSALQTGTMTNQAMIRALMIAEFYFKNSTKAMGLLYEDRDEMRRVRATRFIAENPGCSTRDVLQHLHCSKWQWENGISDTLVARGDIHFIPGSHGHLWHATAT